MHHSKLSAEYKLLLVNGTQWQYYGTPGVGGILLMVWNSSLIKAARVNLELWGYDEFGKWSRTILIFLNYSRLLFNSRRCPESSHVHHLKSSLTEDAV